MKKQNIATPSCKFCEGAGEPKAVYTSHWQFNKPKDGVLTCPKLLAYMCKNCNKHGHNEKHCSEWKQPYEPKQSYMRTPVLSYMLAPVNMPGPEEVLARVQGLIKDQTQGLIKDQTQGLIKDQTQQMELFPVLTTTVKTNSLPSLTGWATVAATKKVQSQEKKVQAQVQVQVQVQEQEQEQVQVQVQVQEQEQETKENVLRLQLLSLQVKQEQAKQLQSKAKHLQEQAKQFQEQAKQLQEQSKQLLEQAQTQANQLQEQAQQLLSQAQAQSQLLQEQKQEQEQEQEQEQAKYVPTPGTSWADM